MGQCGLLANFEAGMQRKKRFLMVLKLESILDMAFVLLEWFRGGLKECWWAWWRWRKWKWWVSVRCEEVESGFLVLERLFWCFYWSFVVKLFAEIVIL